MLASLLKQSMQTFPINAPPPTVGSESFNQMIVKEAIYNAVGHASTELSEMLSQQGFSFTHWYTTVLSPELGHMGPGRHVLRRRVCWMLDEWAGYIDKQILPQVFAQVVRALKDPDAVVR